MDPKSTWSSVVFDCAYSYLNREHIHEDFSTLVYFFVLWSLFYLVLKHHLFKAALTINNKE